MRDFVGRKTLTSREAARLLGVSEASVKRWADGGLLPAVRTAGGHRRFRPEDLAAFRHGATARGGAAAGGEQRPGADGGSTARLDEALSQAMFEMLVRGDAAEASAALVGLHLQGHTVGRLADGALCPALRRVGDLWQAGELTVAQEHVATRTALAALHALRAAIKASEPAGAPGAICCSVEEDFHELPVQVAALTLEARRWRVFILGVSTPFYALAESVTRFRPRLVCVGSTVFTQTDRAAREYGEFVAAAARAGASVVLGGSGFMAGDVRRRFPADLHAATFTELEGHAAALEAGAAAAAGD
ncbi:MAG TPA: B12-binding domain-containing protein [Pyrinomonadaceae bacterium]